MLAAVSRLGMRLAPAAELLEQRAEQETFIRWDTNTIHACTAVPSPRAEGRGERANVKAARLGTVGRLAPPLFQTANARPKRRLLGDGIHLVTLDLLF